MRPEVKIKWCKQIALVLRYLIPKSEELRKLQGLQELALRSSLFICRGIRCYAITRVATPRAETREKTKFLRSYSRATASASNMAVTKWRAEVGLGTRLLNCHMLLRKWLPESLCQLSDCK